MEKELNYLQGYLHAIALLNSFCNDGKTLKEKGEYILNSLYLLFDDLNEIVIYKWGVDCNPYFDAGKEWWGAYFWTVYNPHKNIYIAIVASTTD